MSLYIFQENKERTQGLLPGDTPNSNITWETASKYNLGIDFNIKGQQLAGVLELFYERRSDILAPRNQSVPIYTGFSLPDENIGIVNNRGVELQLNHNNQITKDFRYSIGSQFTFAKSEIEFIDEPNDIPDYQKRTGNPVDFILIYQADGLYQNQAEIDDSVSFPDAKPGDIRFVDKNGDGKIDDNDRIILENSSTPKITYGLSFGFQWNNLGMNLFFQGQALAQSTYRPFDLNQQSFYFENRWISNRETPNATYPAAFSPSDSSFRNISTVWLKSNEFLKLKNIEFSYLLNKPFLNRYGIESLRFALS